MVLTDILRFMSVNGAYTHFIQIISNGYGMMMKVSINHGKVRDEENESIKNLVSVFYNA